MADLTNATKAPLLIDGANPNGATYEYDSARLQIDAPAPDGTVYVEGLQVVADTTITVHQGGRSGVLHVTVTDAPLVLTFGPAVPR